MPATWAGAARASPGRGRPVDGTFRPRAFEGLAAMGSVDDAGAQGDGDHSGAVARPELAGDACQVTLHGERGKPHRDADRLVGLALRNQPQHLDLTAGQLAVAARVAG